MMSHQETAKIVGIGTALPPYRVTQKDLEEKIAQLLGPKTLEARRARAVIRRARVETRYSCMPDFGAEFAGIPFGAKNTTARIPKSITLSGSLAKAFLPLVVSMSSRGRIEFPSAKT